MMEYLKDIGYFDPTDKEIQNLLIENIDIIKGVDWNIIAYRYLKGLEFQVKFYELEKYNRYLESFIQHLKNMNKKKGYKKLLKAFSLKSLRLDACQLDEVPKDVFLCKNLEELSLSNNSLTAIPEEIGRLGNLKKLILSHNNISHLPDEIGSLRSLELLWIDGNPLTSLPASINLLTIHDIDVSKNLFDT